MILVVGATGQLGRMVVKDLLHQKRSVRILVRPGSDYDPLVRAGARAVFGDLKAPITLLDALRGVETLITTANSSQRGGEDNVQNVDLIGNRHLVNSARTAGVKHFIFVSSARADDKSQSPILQAKKKTENHLIQSGLNYTIVAPEPIMEKWFSDDDRPGSQGQSTSEHRRGREPPSQLRLDIRRRLVHYRPRWGTPPRGTATCRSAVPRQSAGQISSVLSSRSWARGSRSSMSLQEMKFQACQKECRSS